MHMKALKRSVKKKFEARSSYRLVEQKKKKLQVKLIDSLNPGPEIMTVALRFQTKSGLLVVAAIECPECKRPIEWDDKWQGFICKRPCHPGRKGVYEMVNPTKVFG
jgi:hypothetical protein